VGCSACIQGLFPWDALGDWECSLGYVTIRWKVDEVNSYPWLLPCVVLTQTALVEADGEAYRYQVSHLF
jgi:hypothetical protein